MAAAVSSLDQLITEMETFTSKDDKEGDTTENKVGSKAVGQNNRFHNQWVGVI